MTAEQIRLEESPESSLNVAHFMDVAQAVFEKFLSAGAKKEALSAEQLAIAEISGARLPLYVIGETGKFLSGEISVHPNSRTDRVIVTASRQPALGESVVANFKWIHKFQSSFGSLSDRCFVAFHCTDTDGSGGGSKGSIAVVRNGELESASWLEGKTIKTCVVFAGIDGLLPRKTNSYHGFVVID